MARPSSLKIWVGTRKGAFSFFSTDRKKWTADGPFLAGEEVHHVAQDPRDPKRLFSTGGNAWIGPHLYASTNGGKTWKLSESGLALKDFPGEATLKRIWHIEPGAADEPGVLYVGADPGVLFRSADNGAGWELISPLSLHATREKWTPGAGGMMVHSIQCLGKGHLIVGISAAGAFRSTDSGKTWQPFNANVRADFLPNKFPEVGQCVHKLKAHPRRPDQLTAASIVRTSPTKSGRTFPRVYRRASASALPFQPLRTIHFSRFRSNHPSIAMFRKESCASLAAATAAVPGNFSKKACHNPTLMSSCCARR